MTIVLRRPTVSDVLQMGLNARQADKDEVAALSGMDIMDVLRDAPDLYSTSYVWEVEGNVICLFGVASIGNDNVLWFLATDEFEKHEKEVARGCRKIFNDVVKDYDYLFNYVHAEHKKALRWVEWLGCEVSDPEPIGVKGAMFCKIEVRNV